METIVLQSLRNCNFFLFNFFRGVTEWRCDIIYQSMEEYEVLAEGKNEEHDGAVTETSFDKMYALIRLLQSGKYNKPAKKKGNVPFDHEKLLMNLVINTYFLTQKL